MPMISAGSWRKSASDGQRSTRHHIWPDGCHPSGVETAVLRKRPSTNMPIAKALVKIRKEDFARIYFLHGPEEFEKEALLKELVDRATDDASRPFNLDVLHSEDLDVADVVARATAFPMMAAHRVMVIKRIDRLHDSSSQALLPLILSPPETTVQVYTAGKVDARRKTFRELRKAALCLEFKTPYENQIPDWIKNRAALLNREIEPEAAHLLHMSAGPQLRDLANELEKIALFVGDRKKITVEDVAFVVNASRGATPFDLADALGNRKRDLSLAILKRLMEHGENGLGVLAILNRHFFILRKVRSLHALRVPRQQWAGQLKVPPYFLSKYVSQASRFSDEALWAVYQALFEADDRLKWRYRSPLVTLSRLVHQICRDPLQTTTFEWKQDA